MTGYENIEKDTSARLTGLVFERYGSRLEIREIHIRQFSYYLPIYSGKYAAND
jgi:hypothetical protein